MHRVLMVLAVAVSCTSAQFMCPDMFGMFRHPDNCSLFFVCNYGMAHERSCPSNLFFDTNLGICRHSSDVQCLQQTQLLTAGFTCSSSVGLFADPFSCEHFYLCANGHPYRQRCPFGLIFDGVVCNWKYDRSCIFQDRIWLAESANNQINERPKDPQRPSKIDIQKMPKISTQQIPEGSIPYSTPDEMSISEDDLTIEDDSTMDEVKGTNERPGKIPTVTPVGRDLSHTETRQKVVATLQNKKGHNSTKPPRSLQETTQNLEQIENVKHHLHEMKSDKVVQNPWKDLKRQQQQRRQQQWMMQRQRQWRLQQRWTRQQQWKRQQEQRKLHEEKQQRRLLEEQWKLREQQRMHQEMQQENTTADESFNQTTIYTRLMAGKVTAKPDFISQETNSSKKMSRRWWRTAWSHRLSSSEKTTYSPWLFPVRHKTQSPTSIAIQAFGLKKSVDNSKDITNNNTKGNFSDFDKNYTSKHYTANGENQSNNSNNFSKNNPSNNSNSLIKNDKRIDTNNNSIDNDRNTGTYDGIISNNTNDTHNNNTNTDNNSIINNDNHNITTYGKGISEIYNNAHVIGNVTNSTDINKNTNTDNIDDSNIYNSTDFIANLTNSTNSTTNSNITNNLNVTMNIDIISYNATNTTLTTSSIMKNTDTIILNSTNSNDIVIRNNTLLGQIYDNTTDAMFVFRSSENLDEKSNFSKPFTKKDTTKKLTTQDFSAS